MQLLAKLERKWPAFRLERLAQSVDQQYQDMGLGIRTDSSLVQRCQNLDIERSGVPAEAAAH